MLGPIFEILNLPSLFSLAGRDVCAWETCLRLGETRVALGETHVPVGEPPAERLHACVRALDVPLYHKKKLAELVKIKKTSPNQIFHKEKLMIEQMGNSNNEKWKIISFVKL